MVYWDHRTNILTQRTVRDLRTDAFNKLQRVPLKYIDSTPHGDIIGRVVADIDTVSDGSAAGISAGVSARLCHYNRNTLLYVLDKRRHCACCYRYYPCIADRGFYHSKTLLKRNSRSRRRSEVRLPDLPREYIGNQKVVKAFSREEYSEEKFEELNAKLYKVGVRAQFYSARTNPSTRFVNGLVYAGVGIFGALSAIGGGITDRSAFPHFYHTQTNIQSRSTKFQALSPNYNRRLRRQDAYSPSPKATMKYPTLTTRCLQM